MNFFNKLLDFFRFLFTSQLKFGVPLQRERRTEEPVVNTKSPNTVQYNPSTGSYVTPMPSRATGLLSGTDFCKSIWDLPSNQEREDLIFAEIKKGNIPEFMKKFCEVKIVSGIDTIKFYVTPDYVSIGSDNDFVRMPMYPLTAQKVADMMNCILPTVKMVDIIFQNALQKLYAIPYGPPYNNEMESIKRFLAHNEMIKSKYPNYQKGLLAAGHKKDIILSNGLAPNNPNKRVGIYGWQMANGQPIQGGNGNITSHSSFYSDYSHGVRLISKTATLNGQSINILTLLTDPKYATMLNREGVLTFLRY